ncbi:integrase [Synechococcus sp. WH 8101]|uniref:site-specific integrase n=1 Tax=Synechococcus sp. WH 8101 TaxID=59932 RepID=UPI001022A270|nr:site-specific integrase [Synechococcus sp. WH 8101]QBE68369.1 integrase [Synechococcus sp. WH 8101]QNI44584.1 phage integrase family protein [Synechococcus sp. WH 8101]
MAPRQQWFDLLRLQLRQQHGKGWSVREIGASSRNPIGRCQLTRIWEDRTRSSVVMPLEWKATNATAILATVGQLRSLMEERNLSLQDAHKLNTELLSGPAATQEGFAGWPEVAARFLKSQDGRRSSTLRDLTARVERTLQALQTKPAPRDGASLMRTYASKFFESCPAGGVGRKRNLLDVARFLTYAVDECGAPTRFYPPSKAKINELIGSAETSAADHLTPPVMPEDLAALLDQLEADGEHELRLAVGLVGLFGLRPAELAVLQVRDGKAYVGNVKRNSSNLGSKAKPARLVKPIDIAGREGEGERLLQLYASGLVKLPKSIRTQIALVEQKGKFQDVGADFRQKLERYKPWQALVARCPGVTPYSLRHGYAWRAHCCSANPMHPRIAAALMGHNVATHLKHYGQWTDEASLEAAVDRYNQGVHPVAA